MEWKQRWREIPTFK